MFAHRLSQLLRRAVLVLALAGAVPGMEQGVGELACRLACAVGLCGPVQEVPSCCAEDGGDSDSGPALRALERAQACECGVVPSGAVRGNPARPGAGLELGSTFLSAGIERGAALSAQTPLAFAEPRCVPRAPHTDSGAPPAATALSGAGRLLHAGAGVFVCVLRCLRT